MRLLLACVLVAPANMVLAQTVASANAAPGTGRSTPITAAYTNESLAEALAAIGEMAGIKILFDADFRDRTLTIRFDGETFRPAMDQLLLPRRLFAAVIEGDAVVISPDSQELRQRYEQGEPPAGL